MIDLNGTLIAQIINFLILVAILTKVAYKPLMKALQERQERIAASIDQADRDKEAAEQLKREYQEQLAMARAEAQAIVEKATRLAEQTKDEIVAAARAEHAKLLKEAQVEIDRERQLALSELRGEVVALSMAAASKIIEKNLDSETNSKLVTDFINRLDDKKIGGLPC
ncbi:ATP synthase subunit b, sodium ion specific [bioreactor metagenome]|uniref:ATP synthase subunit b, sodium ion specific n=1 Tax=bioreactor metagenome TaxID=1076179 RepID=A0A644TRT4_9ZZZZ